MIIEDKELRDLFKIESEEQLLHLERGLLELEQDPGNQAILDAAFREIHSLKGGVRMLFLPEMESIAHCFESILAAARKGDARLNPETIDRLYRGLDALRKLAQEAVTGEPAGVVSEDVVDQLAWIESKGQTAGTEPGGQPLTPVPARTEPPPPATEQIPQEIPLKSTEHAGVTAFYPEPEMERSGIYAPDSPTDKWQEGRDDGEFRIDTIRVATEKLDALMPLLGELGVAKNRLVYRLVRMDEILAAWEHLDKTGVALRASLSELEHSSHNGLAKRLTEQHAQEMKLVDGLGTLLNEVRTAIYEDSSKLELIAGELEESLRSVRLVPLSTVFNLFGRMVRDLARSQGKDARLVMTGGDTTADKRVIEDMKDPLMHMIRNAIDHGIELPDERERLGKPRIGSIELKAHQAGGTIVIELSDDGRGLDMDAIKRTALRAEVCSPAELEGMTPSEIRSLIFKSGFSTSAFVSDVSGRGVGLDVVRTNVERLKGLVEVESTPGAGCTVKVQVPMTIATVRALIVGAAGRKYAVPAEQVESIGLIPRADMFTIHGRTAALLDHRPLSLVRLVDLLELSDKAALERSRESPTEDMPASVPCVVIAVGQDRVGVLVDDLLDEQEIVLKPQSKLLKRVRNVSGATILGTGEVSIVLNPQDLLKSARKRELPFQSAQPGEEEVRKAKTILMAEDSLTTRTQMKRILEGAGYEVVAAVDGLDALNKVATRQFDALVSDIMMPNMDGLTLTSKLRENPHYKELPIILVTTLSSSEDMKRGLQVGANAYITKPAFDQKVLLDTLRRLT